MTGTTPDEGGERRERDAVTDDYQGPNLDHRVASLRGAAAAGVGRRFWLFAGALILIVCAAALVVSFVNAASDNARITRMKSHGITVTVTVSGCTGNAGGSGSNSAGYTCRGRYAVDGVTYRELIGSMSTFAPSGSKVRAVADPSHHSTVVLASAVATSAASTGAYVRPGLSTAVLAALTMAYVRAVRRTREVAEQRTS